MHLKTSLTVFVTSGDSALLKATDKEMAQPGYDAACYGGSAGSPEIQCNSDDSPCGADFKRCFLHLLPLSLTHSFLPSLGSSLPLSRFPSVFPFSPLSFLVFLCLLHTYKGTHTRAYAHTPSVPDYQLSTVGKLRQVPLPRTNVDIHYTEGMLLETVK